VSKRSIEIKRQQNSFDLSLIYHNSRLSYPFLLLHIKLTSNQEKRRTENETGKPTTTRTDQLEVNTCGRAGTEPDSEEAKPLERGRDRMRQRRKTKKTRAREARPLKQAARRRINTTSTIDEYWPRRPSTQNDNTIIKQHPVHPFTFRFE